MIDVYKRQHHVFVNQLGIFLCMFQHMGSGTYNRHFSFENINELRQFVQIALSQEVAEPVSYTHLDVYKRQGLCG